MKIQRIPGALPRRTLIAAAALLAPLAFAQTPGVTANEIVIGTTSALSGPASSYSTISKTAAAWFNAVNDQGGVAGRKIKFIILDDGFSPPKTVEQTRKLVEQDNVAFIALPLGSIPSLAVRKYLNEKKVPQLMVSASLSAFNDPKNYPWTMGFQPTSLVEGRMVGRYIAATRPRAKIGVLSLNDDGGKEYLRGLKEGLGSAANLIVKEATFELTDPSVDSQVLTLQNSGADVFVAAAPPKTTSQALRKSFDSGWKPALQFVHSNSASVDQVLVPAGLDKTVGLISTSYMKDPTDPQWANDKGMQDWLAFMKKYNPGVPLDALSLQGTSLAQTVVQILTQAGKDASRENIMKQAANLDMQLPLLLPGVKVKTTPDRYETIQVLRLQQFDGKQWKLMP